MTQKVTEIPAHLLCCVVTLYLCLLPPTDSQKPAPPCSFILQNNKTMLEKLAYDFDKESSTVILEYAIRFSSTDDAEGFINRSSHDTFEPLRWYRTQGTHSSELLLSYELYFGYLKHILDLNVKKVDIELMVIPPGCFMEVEQEKAEALLEDYLLKDFNLDSSSVKHSFKLSEDVEICSTKLDVRNIWAALSYRCCGYDEKDHVYCKYVSASNWMIALFFFIISVTVILALYFPAMIFKPNSKDEYDFIPAKGSEIKFVMKVTTDENINVKTIPIIKLDTRDDRMKQFQQDIEQKLRASMDSPQPSNGQNTNECHNFEVCVKRARVKISMKKVFIMYRTTFSLFRNALDFYFKNENHQGCCENKTCSKLYLGLKRFMKIILILSILASPSYPLARILCTDELWFRKVVSAYSQRGYSESVYFHWRVPAIAGMWLTAFFYSMCLLHALSLSICTYSSHDTGTIYTSLSDFKEIKISIARSMRKKLKRLFRLGQGKFCVSISQRVFIFSAVLFSPIAFIIYFILTTPLGLIVCTFFRFCWCRCKTSAAGKCNDCKICKCIRIAQWFTFCWVAFVLICGVNYLVNTVAVLIITAIVNGSAIYSIIPITILLLVYIRDCFLEVKTPYNVFMKSLLMTDTCKRLYFNSEDAIQQNSHPGTALKEKKSTTCLLKWCEERKDPLFEVRKNKLRVKLKHPFVYLKEKTMSMKFFLHCATMKCMGAPGTLWNNYEKAGIRFLKIGLFIIFVFLVVMAYGYVSYISPLNQVFITFVAGLLPLLISKFSSSDKNNVHIDSSDQIFLKEFKEKIESFSQKFVLEDFIDAEMTALKDEPEKLDLILISSNAAKETITSTPTASPEEFQRQQSRETCESNQATSDTDRTVIKVQSKDDVTWSRVEKKGNPIL
ncbi:unnamed protein product [Lymnaea stagnalis]|uniref:Uncharacterized protein n=1 Tax=Lymnaea stagnalis TaxID=6523 RepID=A0AAV2I5P2_LYMST